MRALSDTIVDSLTSKLSQKPQLPCAVGLPTALGQAALGPRPRGHNLPPARISRQRQRRSGTSVAGLIASGGTHRALVEAMGFGNVIVANDVPEHRETLGDAGLYYRGSSELASQLQLVLDDKALADDLGRRAHDRARESYSWDAIADAYESWLVGLCPVSG
jgi:glycosyltransferase involved in cell wall biosynthesis